MGIDIIFLIFGLLAMLFAIFDKTSKQFIKILIFTLGFSMFMVNYGNLCRENTGVPIQFSELKENLRYRREAPEAILISTYNGSEYSKELKILLPPQGIPKEYFPIEKPFVRNGKNLNFPED